MLCGLRFGATAASHFLTQTGQLPAAALWPFASEWAAMPPRFEKIPVRYADILLPVPP